MTCTIALARSPYIPADFSSHQLLSTLHRPPPPLTCPICPTLASGCLGNYLYIGKLLRVAISSYTVFQYSLLLREQDKRFGHGYSYVTLQVENTYGSITRLHSSAMRCRRCTSSRILIAASKGDNNLQSCYLFPNVRYT